MAWCAGQEGCAMVKRCIGHMHLGLQPGPNARWPPVAHLARSLVRRSPSRSPRDGGVAELELALGDPVNSRRLARPLGPPGPSLGCAGLTAQYYSALSRGRVGLRASPSSLGGSRSALPAALL